MKKANNNIGILGSSFNPPHLGHKAVIADLLKMGTFDGIWLIPVYFHAFRKYLAPFSHRLAMVRLLALDFEPEKVKVITIEQELNKKPSYTYDVLAALKTKFPDHSFSLILGSDIKQDLNKWHRIDDLKKLVTFHFIPRKGYEESPYPEVSSTQIRERIAQNLSIEGLTTLEIAAYIRKNELYSGE
ncbi:MAG: nicotinate-nicotinamide nucleotide adenylyltransferase [bacterium]|nr:nicotinate-nicotinamide nucleotide adenylyltransferase [bacterium]MBU1917691.1 nicotinate-nicotinamide nucleotide adenylyltransferase [bacterium]